VNERTKGKNMRTVEDNKDKTADARHHATCINESAQLHYKKHLYCCQG
jgi:hypothetical protein